MFKQFICDSCFIWITHYFAIHGNLVMTIWFVQLGIYELLIFFFCYTSTSVILNLKWSKTPRNETKKSISIKQINNEVEIKITKIRKNKKIHTSKKNLFDLHFPLFCFSLPSLLPNSLFFKKNLQKNPWSLASHYLYLCLSNPFHEMPSWITTTTSFVLPWYFHFYSKSTLWVFLESPLSHKWTPPLC